MLLKREQTVYQDMPLMLVFSYRNTFSGTFPTLIIINNSSAPTSTPTSTSLLLFCPVLEHSSSFTSYFFSSTSFFVLCCIGWVGFNPPDRVFNGLRCTFSLSCLAASLLSQSYHLHFQFMHFNLINNLTITTFSAA